MYCVLCRKEQGNSRSLLQPRRTGSAACLSGCGPLLMLDLPGRGGMLRQVRHIFGILVIGIHIVEIVGLVAWSLSDGCLIRYGLVCC